MSPLLAVAALAAAAFGIAFALSGSDASVGRATPAEQPHAFTVSAKAPRLARLAALATPPRLAREPKRRPAATTTPSSTTTTATVTATAAPTIAASTPAPSGGGGGGYGGGGAPVVQPPQP